MKITQSALFPSALLALAASAVLLNPNPEKLLAHGFLTLTFFFVIAIFQADQVFRSRSSGARARYDS